MGRRGWRVWFGYIGEGGGEGVGREEDIGKGIRVIRKRVVGGGQGE